MSSLVIEANNTVMDIINVTYHDPFHGELHVVVSSPIGGGGGIFTVMINNYYKGQIVPYNGDWISYVDLGILTQDDMDAIVDAIALSV